MRRLQAVSPIHALVAALAADLVLNRLSGRELAAGAWMDHVALFALYLTSILALLSDALGTFGLVADERNFSAPARLLFACCGVAFLPPAAAGLFVRLPEMLVMPLRVSFLLSILGVVAVLTVTPARGREKGALWLLIAPLLLHGWWWSGAHLWQPTMTPTFSRALLYAALAAAPLAALLSLETPLASALRGWPLIVGGAVSSVMTAMLGHPELLRRALAQGFGLALLDGTIGRTALVAAGGVFAMALCGLARSPGRDRTRALGLFLIALSGLTLDLPYQLLAIHAGFVLLLRSSFWPAEAGVTWTPERWLEYTRAIATALGADEPIMIEDRKTIITRIRRAGAHPVDVRIVRRRDKVRELSVTVGRAPAVSLDPSRATADVAALVQSIEELAKS